MENNQRKQLLERLKLLTAAFDDFNATHREVIMYSDEMWEYVKIWLAFTDVCERLGIKPDDYWAQRKTGHDSQLISTSPEPSSTP